MIFDVIKYELRVCLLRLISRRKRFINLISFVSSLCLPLPLQLPQVLNLSRMASRSTCINLRVISLFMLSLELTGNKTQRCLVLPVL